MSSSTSSSSRDEGSVTPSDAALWRGFVVRAVLSTVAMSLAILGLFVALDPYDTGRFALVHARGVTETGGRFADASRVHDEGFDAAVFGNSHIMPLRMDRLSAATGLNLVMLGIEGTGVPEQMALLDAYLRRHSPPKALIVAVDWVYCLADPRVHPVIPFPDWLYAPSPWAYLGGLFQAHTFEVLGRRLGVLLGHGDRQPRDGNVDIYRGAKHTPEQAAALIASLPPQDFSGETSMPAFAMLEKRLDQIPPSTAVILVLPPVVAAALPAAGTQAAAGDRLCKSRADDLARGRPNVRVVDWRKRTPETEDVGNFWDPTHYYDAVARLVEQDIAAALATVPDRSLTPTRDAVRLNGPGGPNR